MKFNERGLDARSRSRRGRVIAASITALLLMLFGLDYAFYPWNAPMPGSASGNHGRNGLWLHYTWYFGQHSDAETTDLARSLARRQIAFAYFHVRYIGRSGKLRYRLPDSARHLNALVHRVDPGVKSIAWIYVGNQRGSGSVANLSDPALRRSLVDEAKFLVTDCGFDGVQWDYEICPDGDAGLLDLLSETRAALPSEKLLSIATALWVPSPIAVTGNGWGSAYFGAIARRCDQVVVMGYDSGIYLPRAYAWLMSEQVTQVCAAAAETNANCRVLIGVPTYARGGLSHHAHAENLAVALRGVRSGCVEIGNNSEAGAFDGVALFADYTTRADDWRVYEKSWLGNP